MSVAEWTDAYCIHHPRILWNNYRKLTWVGLEPTTAEQGWWWKATYFEYNVSCNQWPAK